MKFEYNELFTVCHPDGSEWTSDELQDYAFYTELCLDHTQVFVSDFTVNKKGEVVITDDYFEHTVFLEPEDFIIVWNKKKLLEILESGNCQ